MRSRLFTSPTSTGSGPINAESISSQSDIELSNQDVASMANSQIACIFDCELSGIDLVQQGGDNI